MPGRTGAGGRETAGWAWGCAVGWDQFSGHEDTCPGGLRGMGTPGWERGHMDRGTWELLALNGETWLGTGTDGQRAMVTPGPERGNLLGNGDRWAGGHGDSWLGGEEHGDMWSPMGSWTPGQLWGYLSRPEDTWEGTGHGECSDSAQAGDSRGTRPQAPVGPRSPPRQGHTRVWLEPP